VSIAISTSRLASMRGSAMIDTSADKPMQARDAAEVKNLNSRLAATEAAAARECAFQARQLAAARAELDALTGKLDDRRERAVAAAERATINDNIIALHHVITERGGAA
jgi:hypothetical protein